MISLWQEYVDHFCSRWHHRKRNLLHSTGLILRLICWNHLKSMNTGCPQKKLNYFHAAHSHISYDKFYGYWVILSHYFFLQSSKSGLYLVSSRVKVPKFRKVHRLYYKTNHLIVWLCSNLYEWYSTVLHYPTIITILLLPSIWYFDYWW